MTKHISNINNNNFIKNSIDFDDLNYLSSILYKKIKILTMTTDSDDVSYFFNLLLSEKRINLEKILSLLKEEKNREKKDLYLKFIFLVLIRQKEHKNIIKFGNKYKNIDFINNLLQFYKKN
jgi:hypothetical protein